MRGSSPLIHCITNYVTAGDTANMLLAAGASPIMADDPSESAEITALAQGLTLNLGTPSGSRVEAMLRSGAEANRRGIPVVFDPVGAGCSGFRRNSAGEILRRVISWWASVVLAYNSLMVAVMGCMRIRLTGVYTASTTAASTTTTITARQPHGICHAAPK